MARRGAQSHDVGALQGTKHGYGTQAEDSRRIFTRHLPGLRRKQNPRRPVDGAIRARTRARVAHVELAVKEKTANERLMSEFANDPNALPHQLLAAASECPSLVLANPGLAMMALSDPGEWNNIRLRAELTIASDRLWSALGKATQRHRCLWLVGALRRAEAAANQDIPECRNIESMLRRLATRRLPAICKASKASKKIAWLFLVERNVGTSQNPRAWFLKLMTKFAFVVEQQCDDRVRRRIYASSVVLEAMNFHKCIYADSENANDEWRPFAISEYEWMLGCLRGIQTEDRKKKR